MASFCGGVIIMASFIVNQNSHLFDHEPVNVADYNFIIIIAAIVSGNLKVQI